MTKKEFRDELMRIKEDWKRLAQEDPTYYHRSIVMTVDDNFAGVEAVYEGRKIEEYCLRVKLEDGIYEIYVVHERYVSPVDDIRKILYEQRLEYSIV